EAKNEELSFQEGFWDDVTEAQRIMQETKELTDKIKEYEDVLSEIEDLEILMELMVEEESYDEYEEVHNSLRDIVKKADDFRLTTLLNGEFDNNNAILSINAGAGGLEAQDWAEMLLRLYRRWAEAKGYGIDTLDIQADTEGGIKSVTLLIKGSNSYGYLKCEKGVHRLIRISPFDSSGKRHTSFASIDVFPQLTE